MRLKHKFDHQTVCGLNVAVSTSWNGIIQNNDTTDFIFKILQNDVTFDQIVDAMLNEYDADRATIEADVQQIIQQLREADLIIE